MRWRTYAGLALIACLWTACASIGTTIRITQTSASVVERGTLLEEFAGDLGFDDMLEMDISEAAELQNQGVGPGDIKKVQLDELVLTVTDPNGADLSFLDTLAFYVEADGLPRERIAYSDDFPAGVGEISMELDDVDIVEYAVKDSMNIVTEVTGTRPDVDTTIEGRIVLAVGVTAQGACNQLN